MSRTYSARQWAEWIEQQKKSGLSVAAFCERIGVSQNAFYWRRRRLAEQAADRSSDVAPFVAVQVTDTAPVEVEFPCGVTVRVSDPASVRTIVAELLDRGTHS